MDILQRLENAGVVPVVVIEDAKDAVPTAKAMLEGGIDVMEITFRTAAAADSIKAVSDACPDMLVGAGTVLNVEQCEKAIGCGAKFIVSPGFDADVVRLCQEKGVAATPGCVTPTEITAGIKMGLKVLKFFPANVYGGLSALKALSAPFGGIKFIPTGGVNEANLAEFIRAPFIHAVGGSWVCPKADITAGNFGKITALCKEARRILLGFEIEHLGIDAQSADEAKAVANEFNETFGLAPRETSRSVFASDGVEVMYEKGIGEHGHIAVRTNRVSIAIADLAKRGFEVDMSTARYKGDKITFVYLKKRFGGFAVHLLEK